MQDPIDSHATAPEGAGTAASATADDERCTPEELAELRALGFDPDDPLFIVAKLRADVAELDRQIEAADGDEREHLRAQRASRVKVADEIETEHRAQWGNLGELAHLTDAEWQHLRDRLAPLSVQVETLGKTHLLAQQAELVTAAALESLCERDEDGNYRWSAGPHHGLACPPSLAGFAAVHCRLSRAELGALARLVHSERTQPQIREAVRRGLLTPRAARRLRAITHNLPELLKPWLAQAANERRFTFERRTELAMHSELPHQVSLDRPMPAIAPAAQPADEPISTLDSELLTSSSEGARLRISLGLPHMDAYWWSLASGRAGRATKKGYLGPMATLAALAEKLAAEVAAGRVPASLDAIDPYGEFHIDAIDQEPWVNAGRNALGIGLDEIPGPGPKVVAEILSEERARLPHTRAAALAAWPELADDRLPPTPDDPTYERFVRTGLVTWGHSRLVPDPARALPARGHEAVLAAEAATPPDSAAAPLEGRRGRLSAEQGLAELSNVDSQLHGAPGSPGDPLNTPEAAEAALTRLARFPVSSLTVPERQALAVAAARAWHHAVGREAELVVQASPDSDACPPDPLFHTLDALGYFEGEAPLIERRILEQQLEALPQLRNTRHAGLCSYTNARIAARKARSSPEYDADWADLAQRCDTVALQAFARATPKGEAPPRVSEGTLPIRPAGGRLPLQLRGQLDGASAVALGTVLGALAKLAGRELEPAEWVPVLAKWYCQVTQTWTHHTVIYHRSPMTRAAEFPRSRLAESLWHVPPGLPGSTRRLEAAMAWITDWEEGGARAGASRRRARDAGEARDAGGGERSGPPPALTIRPDRRAHRELRAGERYTPPVIEDIVRWMDGEACRTAGCTNDTSQHDHGNPVGDGGHADAALDGRRCGPDNRARNEAKHATDPPGAEPQPWLNIEHGPFGTEIARDRWGRRLGSVRTLYAAWDAPVRRWLARRAHDVWIESPTLMTPFWAAVDAEDTEYDDFAFQGAPRWRSEAEEEAAWLAERDSLANSGVVIPDWATTGPDPPSDGRRWGYF